MSSERPVIGVVLDNIDPAGAIAKAESFQYSRYPWYALKGHYVSALESAGGIPIMIPPLASQPIADYFQVVDGVVIPGSCYDIDPTLYGEDNRYSELLTNPVRTQFEWDLTTYALAHDIPYLGVCGGFQILNVVLGGTLHQHLPDDYDNGVSHKPEVVIHNQPAHAVAIVKDTKLAHLMPARAQAHVNSVHHQGICKLGDRLIASAHAPDGLIEAIESPEHDFILGVQWHPEFLVDEIDHLLFKGLVKAAQRYKQRRKL